MVDSEADGSVADQGRGLRTGGRGVARRTVRSVGRDALSSATPRAPRRRLGWARLSRQQVLVLLVWAAVGGFIGGLAGAAGAGVAALFELRRRGASSAWALVGVVAAAVFSLVPNLPSSGDMNPSFADPDRMWAARAAAFGAAALLVALGSAVVRSISPGPSPTRDDRRSWRSAVSIEGSVTGLLPWLPVVGAAAAGVLVAPRRLPPGYETARVAAAMGNGVMSDAVGAATALHGPLTSILTSVVPIPLVAASALALLTWAIGSVVSQLAPTSVGRARLVAVAFVAVSPLMWARQTPEVLAAACVAVALRCMVARRGVDAVVLAWIVAASWARPEVLLLVPVALVWALMSGVGAKKLLVGVATVVVLLAPWVLWVHGNVGSWSTSTAVGPAFAAARAADLGADLGGAKPVALRTSTGAQAHLQATRSQVRAALDRPTQQWSPRAVMARSLRSLSLWGPAQLRDSAETRGRITRAATLAQLIDLATLVALGWCFVARVGTSGSLGLLRRVSVALVVAGLVVAAATYGDPALLAWTRVGAMAILAVLASQRATWPAWDLSRVRFSMAPSRRRT